MKHCRKCNQEVEDFGSQRYCKACWRIYDRDRRSRKTRVKAAFKYAQAQVAILLSLSPEAQDRHADELTAYYNDFPELRPKE